MCSFHQPSQPRFSSFSRPWPVADRMLASCHQPPFINRSGEPSWPSVWLFQICLFGRGLANTGHVSACVSTHGAAMRTGVVEVEDVDSLDVRHGRELLVVA
jgi:hypothetical protein